MPMESHLNQLERKHRALEQEIEAELHRPACDGTRLAELKRRKLTLKDRIHRLRDTPSAH
jgi:hypothetical protein